MELALTIRPLVFVTLASAAAAWLTREAPVHRFYFFMMFTMGALTCFTGAKAMELSAGQYVEAFSVLCGLLLIGMCL